MRAVIIEESTFDRLFELVRDKLELEKHRKAAETGDPNELQALTRYYRLVNFEISQLQDTLKKQR